MSHRQPGCGIVYGYLEIDCLPDLIGLPWNPTTAAYVTALRPSRVRVLQHDECRTSDSCLWRVTVTLRGERVAGITQEVEIELPDGVTNGWELDTELRQMIRACP